MPTNVKEPTAESSLIDPQSQLRVALLAVQSELVDPGKSATNTYFKSKYVTLHDLLKSIRPILTKHKIILLQEVEHFGVADSIRYSAKTTMLHVNGASVSTSVPIVLTDNSPQAVGSALTYAKRQGLSMLLPVAGPDEDDDGEAATQPTRSSKPKTIERKIKPKPKPQTVESFDNIETALSAIQMVNSTEGLSLWAQKVKAANFQGADLVQAHSALDAKKKTLAAS